MSRPSLNPPARPVEEGSHDRLGHLVTASGELVEYEVLAGDRRLVAVRRLLDVVQRPRHQHVIGDAPPIDVRVDALLGTSTRTRADGGRRNRHCPHRWLTQGKPTFGDGAAWRGRCAPLPRPITYTANAPFSTRGLHGFQVHPSRDGPRS